MKYGMKNSPILTHLITLSLTHLDKRRVALLPLHRLERHVSVRGHVDAELLVVQVDHAVVFAGSGGVGGLGGVGRVAVLVLAAGAAQAGADPGGGGSAEGWQGQEQQCEGLK